MLSLIAIIVVILLIFAGLITLVISWCEYD